ncbi:hypothetical protein V9T40_012202 [Parthenolecanium corni]|uniref:Protein-lysine N-methyltransferase V9T40_012202 n=1 Tax=Parthenolecanium corni TaxID=536013 RepID=A0AAN9TMQ5_9HEMI
MEGEDMELNSSELGTKKFWDATYDGELKNYKDHGNVGEVWFGEESILRIIQWLKKHLPGSERDSIVDLGCGNGMMLIEMAREGYENLTGYDYSEQAIQLAMSIVEEQKMDSIIKLQVCDLISSDIQTPTFSIALDKGTYDAVCLNPSDVKESRKNYLKNIYNLLKPSGLFVITSCNWSDDEIISHFNEYFKLHSIIPTPEFSFGGKSGKLVSCLVLQKVDKPISS